MIKKWILKAEKLEIIQYWKFLIWNCPIFKFLIQNSIWNILIQSGSK